MSVLIRASTSGLRLGGWVGESSGGNKACVFTQAFNNGPIWAYEDINNTPSAIGSSQSNATIFGDSTTNLQGCDAAIDSNNVVHVIAACDESGGGETRVVAYNTISDLDGTPAWGTWSTILTSYNKTVNTMRGVALDVDSNDVAHVLFIDYNAIKGTSYGHIYYSENSAGWSTPVAIVSTSAETDFRHPRLSMKASDNAEAIYENNTNGDAHKNTLTSGSWGTDTQIRAATNTGSVRHGSIIIESGGTVRRYHVDVNNGVSSDVYEEATDTTINTRVELTIAGVSGYIDANDSDKRYLFYVDTGADVHLYSNDGGGWTDEGDLDTAQTWHQCIVGWQWNNLNNSSTIDRIMLNSSGSLYWDEYTLTVAARRVFVTHV